MPKRNKTRHECCSEAQECGPLCLFLFPLRSRTVKRDGVFFLLRLGVIYMSVQRVGVLQVVWRPGMKPFTPITHQYLLISRPTEADSATDTQLPLTGLEASKLLSGRNTQQPGLNEYIVLAPRSSDQHNFTHDHNTLACVRTLFMHLRVSVASYVKFC